MSYFSAILYGRKKNPYEVYKVCAIMKLNILIINEPLFLHICEISVSFNVIID